MDPLFQENMSNRGRGHESTSRSRPAGEVVYVGEITPFGAAVLIRADGIGRPLALGRPGRSRSYKWGCSGLNPRELSRAILLDATENEMLAERLCRPFTWEVISGLPPAGFQLARSEVLAWIESRSSSDPRPRLVA